MNDRIKKTIGTLLVLASVLTLNLRAQDLTGIWQGTVVDPDSKQPLRTVVKIAAPEGDSIKANVYSIDQTYLVFPATLTLRRAVVKMSIPGMGAAFEGKLGADGNTISGAVKGFSTPAPWVLKRVNAEQAWAIPQPPTPAKTVSTNDPSFEVAAIKRSDPAATGGGVRTNHGIVTIAGVTLANLLMMVYDTHPQQIIGAPAWVNSEKFDITAKTEDGGQPNLDQMKVMVGKLLAERFQFAFHREQKEIPVYCLRVAKGGAKISANDSTSAPLGIIYKGPGNLLFHSASLDDLSKALRNTAVDRPVVNETNLTGKYDFSLVWTPDPLLRPGANPNPGNENPEAPPDIFLAIQQQLGLRLSSEKVESPVVVIDRVERPSDN